MAIDVQKVNENVLDGMANMISDSQWEELMLTRSPVSDGGNSSLYLSKDFIVKYRNRLGFRGFCVFAGAAWDASKLDMDFLHRFWRFVTFSEGSDTILSFSDVKGSSNNMRDAYIKEVNPTCIMDIYLGTVPPFSLKELDARPFHYNMEQWRASINMLPEIDDEFIDKYIHMMDFSSIITNDLLSKKRKQEIANKYGILDGNFYVFPCGASVSKSFDSLTSGHAFLRNKNRFGNQNLNEATMKTLIERFPRAFEDCAFPENAAVMVNK